jgi:hypothetical protein
MKLISLKITMLLSILLLFSCQNNKPSFYEELLKTETGQLRGASIGATIEEIKLLENELNLKEITTNYIHYAYEMGKENSYTIRYHFSADNKLHEIELAVFLATIDDAALIFKQFSFHFNRKYSAGRKEAAGYTTWQTNAGPADNSVAIAMINDSRRYGYVTLLIRDLAY